MIIETSDNRFYNVRNHDLACMDHCFLGVELKQTKKGFVERHKIGSRQYGSEVLVRKAATRVVEG